MNTVFSKNKEKRPRTSSSETNTSFVKNVTSRVSGLLPSTITKWFSSPSSSNANGSAQTADATDSSTEDEASDSPVVTQPPLKRMRFNTPIKYNHFAPADVSCTTNNIEITEIPVTPYSAAQFPASRGSLTISPIRSSNETITNITNETIKEKNERETTRFKSTQHSVSNIGQSVATKRKSIFDRKPKEDAPEAKSSSSAEKKPCFKPSLLGSPFYPGRTMYGGAASSYINQPNIHQHTVALVNDTKSSEDSVMSSSVRRIMDLLESYSSPLMEARRIPQYTKPKNNSFDTTNRFPYGNKTISYKTQELHVPSIASIMRLKQRSRLMDSTKAARQIIASHSSAANYPLSYPTGTSNASTNTTETIQPNQPREETEKEQSNKMTTKLKARVTRVNRGNNDEIDIATPVKLPSATLQIDQNKLPKFNFNTPAVSTLSATSTPKVALPVSKPAEIKNNTDVSASKPEIVTSSSIFKFSNPVRISYDTPDADTTPPKFIFDSPERRIDQNCDRIDVSSVVGNVKEADKAVNKPKDWKCPDCWVSNKVADTKCVCCGYKQPAKSTKCVVCKLADSLAQKDKCINCEKMTSPPSAKSNESSKWKCDSCWVMNENTAQKCVCCGGSKPTEASKAAKEAAFAAIPKVPNPTCGGCFSNFSSPTTWSPGEIKQLKNPSNLSSDKSDSAFITIIKTQRLDKWECASCLVRNDSDKSVCVCCGTEKEPKTKLPDSKFNFGLDIKSPFKFGIDPKVQKETIAKKPEVTSTIEPKLKEQSETNNNVLAETPTFTFTLPTKKIDSQADTAKAKAEEAAKFTFGIPKNVSSSTNKIESVKAVNEDKEKPQEVPQVNFSSPIQEKAKPLGVFTSPLTQLVDKEKPTILQTNLFTAPTTETKKDSPSNQVILQPAATSAEKPQSQTTFIMGSGTDLKPATNLFGTPTSISSSANPFSSPPAPTSTVKTSSSSMSLVSPAAGSQKSDVSSSSAMSTPAAPLFSFGTNGAAGSATTQATVASAAPSAEKPKFQFTFGSNSSTKTDSTSSLLPTSNAPPVFKSPFGTMGDAKNTNSFSLTPASTLGNTNALSTGGTLTGTNGLNTVNGLPGNGLAGNVLGGTTLGNNTLGNNNLGSNPLGSNTLGNNTLGSSTLGSSTLGSNTLGSNTLGGNTLGSNTLGGNNLSGNPLGGSTLPGNGLAGHMLGGSTLSANAFSGNNNMTSGNGVTSTSTLGGANGLSGNTGGNALQSNNTLTNNNTTLNATPNIFGTTVQKENIWNSNNNTASTNLFVPNTTASSLQKPPTFTFGSSSTPFNANSSTPTFGNNAQPQQNIFGMSNQQNNNSQPSLFSNPVQSQTPAPIFGSPQPPSNPTPQMGMFGSSNIGATFGSPNPSLPTFETPSMTSTSAPAFNFGAPAPSAGIFGFGQPQPPQQQPQQAGVYSFGGAPPVAPQVQFTMGTAPNTVGRRVRKAVRRTTPR